MESTTTFKMWLVRIVCAAIVTLVVIVITRTALMTVRAPVLAPCQKTDADFIRATPQVVGRFQQALRFQTVSTERGLYNREELDKLRKFIETSFPVIYSSPLVQHEVVNNYSLLFTIKGANSSLAPYLLCSHMDVVPAKPDRWEVPPFSGEIKDGYIYGRGALDFKHGVMGILEALEFLLTTGRKIERSFYVGFGHDEEVGGFDGAQSISHVLQQRGVTNLEFLLDEGLTVTNGLVPGVAKPVAIIGIAEKGQAVIELRVEGLAGHSSMPPPESSIGILANAVARLESNPQPSMFGYGPEKDTFEHLAPEMKLPFRIVMSNIWLFGGLISKVMSGKPVTNAIVRTVTSVTMFNAGIKWNVIPPSATAIVNHRIHPAQSVQEVIDYTKKVIADERVSITLLRSLEPALGSPYGDEDFGYQTLKDSIRQVWTKSLVTPGVMVGNTDTRHYAIFTKNIYRFSPTVMYPGDPERFHGDNERLSVKNYEQTINFYYHVMLNADKSHLDLPHKHSDEL